ncbi:MAG: ferrochelatase [Bradymonadaceae bacterium]
MLHDSGVLLVNLGSPDSTDEDDVREYLREFLNDGRVIDLPWPLRRAVVGLFVLPFRPADSAEAYEEIWTSQGSPLIETTRTVVEKLEDRVDPPVEMGMRYGNPSIEAGLSSLAEEGVDDVFVVPLYPHFAMSSYETAVAETQKVAEEMAPSFDLTFQPPFYDDPDYIDALVSVADPYLDRDFDRLLFSYHGVPRRHITKRDPTNCYCLEMEDCCRRRHPANGLCYRHQIVETTRLFADQASIPEEKWDIAFQSRLGPDEWLEPFTADMLEAYPSQGVENLLVMCPAFVSDCLETLEEIGLDGRETFLENGGAEFDLIPCLNESDEWIAVLEKFVGQWRADDADSGVRYEVGAG